MIFQWNGKFVVQDQHSENCDYFSSLNNCAEFLMAEIKVFGGPKAIDSWEAAEAIANSDMILLIGDSFIAGFEVGKPWQYVDLFLCEEFYGPRFLSEPVDLVDFQAGATALAKYLGCKWLEFGTRSSSKPLALARKSESPGTRVAAVTMQREIL